MSNIIKDKRSWISYYGTSGMTAQEWTRQVLGSERETETIGRHVMLDLNIGGWSHGYHYVKDCEIDNTQHAFERLSDEVERLAKELDKRLDDLTAVETRYQEMIKELDK